MSRALGFLVAGEAPSRRTGVVVAGLLVALCTLIIYPLKHAAPVVSLGVVYLLAVLVVSAAWGVWLGVGTAVVSAAAFNFFHLPPTGRFTIAASSDWVALVFFFLVAVVASSVAEVTRARAREASDRRREADLSAEMASTLLSGHSLAESLPTASARLAAALDLSSASIELGTVEGGDRRLVFALRDGPRRVGSLIVPADTPETALGRLAERVVPALEALLSAALERETLQAEVVETSALRRADVVKTALLRAVSHDLRSPLTAISAAGEAIGSPRLTADERQELTAVIQEETQRLSRLVDNLLDLSRLEAGAAPPRRLWTSLEEVIGDAVRELGGHEQDFKLSLDRDLPLLNADPVQLERAFVNVLENARRHSGGFPVSVRARRVRERMVVRVVDRGPGIPPAQQDRVFEPFYRAGTADGGHRGSGLGLAIARGFVEANGGTLHVESLPGQGATFVFVLPIEPVDDVVPEPLAPEREGVA